MAPRAPRFILHSLSLAVACAGLLVSAGARATPNFPPAIARVLGAGPAPDCSVCHQGRTGRGTVTTAFGAAMRARGLVAYDETSLEGALRQLETDRVDSDGDGVTDPDAIRSGADPNPVANLDITPAEPEFGCVARVASRPHPPGIASNALALSLLATATALVRRARRARRAR